MLINTGWHRRYSDSQEYFGHAPGLCKKAAEWLVKKKVKLVGVDTACVDHPLATSLGPHRNGPQIKYLLPEYKKKTGRDAIKDFPEWNAAHKVLLGAGIPTIENVGGDLDKLSGKRCTFQGFPWKWHEGDACVIRLVAILDPKGTNRLESGETQEAGGEVVEGIAARIELYDLTHRWGHGMPQWPSRANLNVRVVEFHAKDGLLVQQFEGIMHRGTHMDAPIHVQENQPTLTGYPLWRFFGTGVVVSIPKKKWGVITPKDLENAEPKIQKNDIVMINTGSHKNYGDNPDYFAYSPGLYKEAAEWIVERGVKLVGIDVQALDHPLGTFLGPHGPGPGAAASRRRVFRRDRPPHHRRLPALGAGAQDHDDQRHPRHREHRRRDRQDHRQALHLLRLPVALAGRRGLRAARGGGARSGAGVPVRDGR